MVVRDRHVGLGKKRRGGKQVGHAVEDCSLLCLVARRVGVERRVERLDALAERRFAASQCIGKRALSGGGPRGGHVLIHVRKVGQQDQMCKHRLPSRRCAG